MLAALQDTWTVRTSVFDGPLDLLLYLVKRDGIDLRRVSIAGVCDSYLDFLGRMRELNINVASDYLVMAATLCHLKSLELLPRPPAILEDEVSDPKEALARRLEIYERFKLAAEQLDARPILDRDTFAREPLDTGDYDRPLIPGVDAFALLDLYYGAITRPIEVEPVHTIHRPEVDLGACCRQVLGELGGRGGVGDLGTLLRGFVSRAERVITFVAVLEMARLGWLTLEQVEHLSPVRVLCLVPADQPLDAIRGDALDLEPAAADGASA